MLPKSMSYWRAEQSSASASAPRPRWLRVDILATQQMGRSFIAFSCVQYIKTRQNRSIVLRYSCSAKENSPSPPVDVT